MVILAFSYYVLLIGWTDMHIQSYTELTRLILPSYITVDYRVEP